MKYIDLTLPTPEQNLACDEALLDLCEREADFEILRTWEPSRYFVVLGYANKVNQGVKSEICQKLNVPILRRCSGGGTVLQGPGCLNYSLVLRMDELRPLATVNSANAFIMRAHQQALVSILNEKVAIEGHTDLVIGGLKFSGNAQRRKRRCLLFHGSFLLNFDLSIIEKLLQLPSKQPAYRRRRSHLEFLMNLKLPSNGVKEALRKIWAAQDVFDAVPLETIEQLVKDKYSQDAWTLKFE